MDLTLWHWLLIIILILVQLVGTVLLWNNQLRYSLIGILLICLLLLGFIIWSSINLTIYRASLHNIKYERHLMTEEIIFTGLIQNESQYPISNVTVSVQLVNSNPDNKGLFSQTTAFEEIFEKDSPEIKKQNVEEDFIVAEKLPPMATRPFTIRMKFPPYFTDYTYHMNVKL